MSDDDNTVKFVSRIIRTAKTLFHFMWSQQLKWKDAVYRGNNSGHQMTNLSQETDPDGD